MLSGVEYDNMVKYLTSVTNYSINSLLAKEHKVIFQMYNRIKECMENYPDDIIILQNSLYIKTYTLDELKKMNYHQLSSIKKDLKNKLKSYKNSSSVVLVDDSEYLEPTLISPDDLYISYSIDYNNYTDEELLKMGYIVIDRNQDNYLSAVRESLYERLINIFKKSKVKIDYENITLPDLIDCYITHFNGKKQYKLISDIEDEIRLEKRYKNE